MKRAHAAHAIERDAGHAPVRLILSAHARETLHSSDSNDWYTPREFVDAARETMGSIELDPASCEEANRTVRADRIYTINDDGFRQPWKARTLWLNPPYGKEAGKSLQARWSHRLLDEHRAGNVEQACLLVNAMTGNKWFAPLWQFPISFVESRIHFVAPAESGLKDQPTHGSVVVYLGLNHERFAEVFGKVGHVVLPLQVALNRSQRSLL